MKQILVTLLAFTTLASAAPLVYEGTQGPGKGKRIVLIAADQEYRSEQSMPMLAKILSAHHGFDCTVLFAVNDKGEVDPTMPVYPEKGKELKQHHIPGLEQLAKADLVIFFPRLLTLKLKEPGAAKQITYLQEIAWSQDTLLNGANGLAALTFCEVPIAASKAAR